jgi:ankyrin repeat protein
MRVRPGIVDSPECVELLLQHGAKVNAQDLKNNTAAMVACFFNKPRILTTLIRAGADLTVRNNEGISSLKQTTNRTMRLDDGTD